MDNYSAYVREFRDLILSKVHYSNDSSIYDTKIYLKKIFVMIDKNHDGIITREELYEFINKLDLQQPQQQSISNPMTTISSYCDILINQIDIDNDGRITYHELMEFLWPKELSQREIGIVIQKIRIALLVSIKNKSKNKFKTFDLSKLDNNSLIESFANFIGAPLLRGNLVEVRALRNAFAKLHDPTLGTMSKYEVDILVSSLDMNCDGVVSAREFRKWLLREEDNIEYSSNLLNEEMALIPDDNNLEVEQSEGVEVPEKLSSSTESVILEDDVTTSQDINVEQDPIVHIFEQSSPQISIVGPEIIEQPLTTEANTAPQPTTNASSISNTPHLPPITSNTITLTHENDYEVTSDPKIGSTSLNQRKIKNNESRIGLKDIENNSSTSSSNFGSGDIPTEHSRNSTIRWVAFIGIGVLVVYAMYRGFSSTSMKGSSTNIN